MKRGVLLDTGPWVAFLNERDKHHSWAREALRTVQAPLLTCEAVVSEVGFLAGFRRDAVMEMLAEGLVRLSFQLAQELPAVQRLLVKYADQPMSVADACLVRMVEIEEGAAVMTLDGDFRVYRAHGRRKIELIAP